MDLINASIEYGAKGTTNKEITKNILSEWRGSQKILDMVDAEKYYLVQNTGIDSKTRDYRDTNGVLVHNETLTNTKARTSRYRNNVNRKINFALNKPFVISCDNEKYKEEWENFLNDNIRDIISRTGKQGINKGISWDYVWIDEQGKLQIIDTESQTIYPAWTDIAHTRLDAIVRDYIVKEYNNQSSSDVYKVEFWDNEIVQRFIDYGRGEGTGDLEDEAIGDNEESELDSRTTSVLQAHMTKTNEAGIKEGVSWGRVPFIYFKGNDDELPLLNECKDDIDNRDMIKSKGIDSVLDDIDPVLVVEDIDPSIGNLIEARQLIQNSRIISVEQGGKVYYVKVDNDITNVKEQIDQIDKDLINDTNDIDVTKIEFGSNPSGVALRMFFEPLNIWANGFEKQFRVFMKQLKYFFDMWLSFKGELGSFEQLQEIDITFTLDRDLLIDESTIINNLMQMQDEISQETRLELNPYVDDVEKEKKRLEEDKQQALKDQELFGFQQDVDNSVDNSQQNVQNEEDEEKTINENKK